MSPQEAEGDTASCGSESNDDADPDVGRSLQYVAVLEESDCFIAERRERRVCAAETIAEEGTGGSRQVLAQRQSVEQPEEKRAGEVDDDGSPRTF